MMFRFPSVICTRCTGFFCLAIIKGPPNDIYCIIEEPYRHYFTEKISYSQINFPSVICTRCTGFFCLAIIKGPPNDIYCIIEEPYRHYFTEKISYSQIKL